MFYMISFFFCWVTVKLFYPTKVIGKKNLPKKQGYVLTCNHYSNMDPILLDVCLGKKLRYLAKKELFKNKFIGWCLKKFGGYPVDREKADIGAFKFAVKTLKDDKVLTIFPEGTRNKGNDDASLQDIKAGAITFASKAGVPIIPAMIYRRGRVWRKNYIVIGEPFNLVAENPSRLTHEETEDNALRLKNAMTELRDNLDKQFSEKKAKKLAKKHKLINSEEQKVEK